MSLEAFDKVEHYEAMEWMSCGTHCQRHLYRYGGTVIVQDTRFPWRRPNRTWFHVDYILPAESKAIIEQYGGEAVESDRFYCEPGSWFAQFDEAADMVRFVDEYLPTVMAANLEVSTE